MNTSTLLENDIYPRLSHDIVFRDLNPKERGSYFVMDCPFCGKKGEFYGYKEKPFGVCNRKNNCGKSLTWWDHIQKAGNLSNQETLLKLAELAGVDIKKKTKPIDTKEKAENDLLEAFWEASRKRFFSWKEGLNYLTRRKFPEGSLKTLEIGFYSKELILSDLKAQGFKESQIKESPIGTSGFGTIYKMVLPWRDEHRKIKGFVGRCIGDPPGDLPKYKYTMGLDTSMPFNIHNSRAGEKIILVEGVLDALHLMAEGVENVVALGRDKISGAQIENLLKLNKKEFLLALDNDEAGRKGTEKSIIALSKYEGINVYVVQYGSKDGAKDPDEFIRANGVEQFINSTMRSQKGVLWIADWILVSYNTSHDIEREHALLRAVEVLESIKDPINRKDFKARISSALRTTQEALEEKARALKEKKMEDIYRKRFIDTLHSSYRMLKQGNLSDLERYIGEEIGSVKEEGMWKSINGAKYYSQFLKKSYSLLKSGKPNSLRILFEEELKHRAP